MIDGRRGDIFETYRFAMKNRGVFLQNTRKGNFGLLARFVQIVYVDYFAERAAIRGDRGAQRAVRLGYFIYIRAQKNC